MTHGGFVLAAWIIVGVVLALYAARLIVRGRALTKSVAPENRRWMQTTEAAAAKDRP